MRRKHISDYHQFHAKKVYGTGGKDYPSVLPHILALAPSSIIDYGAGRSEIALWLVKKAIASLVVQFDLTASNIYKIAEERFDVVPSFDVLEHIPVDMLYAPSRKCPRSDAKRISSSTSLQPKPFS